MLSHALFQTAAAAQRCLALGFCPAPEAPSGTPPGLMFLALGLVVFGVQGLRRKGWSGDR